MSLTGSQYGALSSYIGREPELDRLQHRLGAARHGRGSLVIMRGPGGSGITRTAHELAARADRLGMLVVWGRARESTRGRPYSAIAGALEDYAAGLPAQVLAGQLADGAAVLARLVPQLSRLLPELTPAAPLEARDERLRLYGALLGWLNRAGQAQPLLLVLDDLQWADGDTLRLLEYISPRIGRLPLLVLAGTVGWHAEAERAREEAPAEKPHSSREGAAPGAGLQVPDAETVELEGLDEGATAAIVETIADEPISRAALALIWQVSRGEPLWARELYRFLHEENRLDPIHGRGLPQASELPESLEQLVAWRTSRLSPEVRSALSALAAFDEGCAPGLLAQIAGLSRSRSIEFLEIGANAGLCRRTEHGQRYVVAHDRLRLALLGALTPVQRAQLHRRAAEALEEELATEIREHAGELLHHYLHSAALEGAQRGVRHGIVAAEQARAAYAHARAAECLQQSLSLTPGHERLMLAELNSRLALALAEAGLAAESMAAAAEALRRQRQIGARPAQTIEPLVQILRVLRGDAAPGASQEAVEELRRLGLEQAAGADQLDKARLELAAERWEPFEAGAVRSLVWRQATAAALRPLAESGSEGDRAELLLPQRVRSPEEGRRAAGWARSWRRPSAVLRAMSAVSLDLTSRHGLFREGASWAALYLSNSERYGSLADRVAALALLARSQLILGHFEQAEATLGEAREGLEQLPQRRWLGSEVLLSELALAYYLDGDRAALSQRIEDELREPSPAGLLLAAEAGLLRARSGDESGARDQLPDVLEACTQLAPHTLYRDAALLAALACAWELGAAEHSAAGRRLLDLAITAGIGSQSHGGLRLAKGRLIGLAGDVPEARSFFAEERPLLDELGLLPLRAVLDHDEGLVIAAGGPAGNAAAAELLERAAGQFAALGMSGWLARTEQLLEDGFDKARQPGGRLAFTYPRGLSRREADVVRLVSGGVLPSEAAQLLELELADLERHLATAMEKLEVGGQEELPRAARRHGLGGRG